MTVRENILHSSRIRIGRSWKDDEIKKYVDHLISTLGLNDVRDRLVGEVGDSGISGGERKRVNVALELAAAPGIIVCDEPTSGLDAKTALSLIDHLKYLKNYGITVVCVLHQPRPEIFASLDKLLLLSCGRQVYFGAAAAAQQCFENAGHHFPAASNPADTIMDVISCYDNIGPNCHSSNNGVQRGIISFLLEIITGAGTGLLIGLSNYEFKGHMFQGLFYPPFQPLSSPGLLLLRKVECTNETLQDVRLAQQVSKRLVKRVSAAYTLHARKANSIIPELVFSRESSSGHSESAYFLGKILSTLIRMFLSALHFTAFYLILTTPIASFSTQLILNLLYFYCMLPFLEQSAHEYSN
ncbi:ABC transporter [Penicillium lividum]|nr:ABC transporter [Penicillium lividum]